MWITDLNRTEHREHRVLVSTLKRFVPPLPFHKDPELVGSGWLLKTLAPSFQPSAPQRSFFRKIQCPVPTTSAHSHRWWTKRGGRHTAGFQVSPVPGIQHLLRLLLCSHQDVGLTPSRGGERAESDRPSCEVGALSVAVHRAPCYPHARPS